MEKASLLDAECFIASVQSPTTFSELSRPWNKGIAS